MLYLKLRRNLRGDFVTKWDRAFRIAVVLLLSANLAVSSVICARLANVTPAVGSGKNSSAEEKVWDYAEPIAPESPAAIAMAPNATWESPSPMKENRFSTSVTPRRDEQSAISTPTMSA